MAQSINSPMRIIAGKYRGLILRSLKGGNLRPTSDQLRETLFDVLGPQVAGSTFLDAYAGSGAVGLEALSRGASKIVFIEHHRAAAQLIRKNIESLNIESGVRLLACHVTTGLERLEGEDAQFSYIFLDPPYKEIRDYHRVLRQLSRGGLMSLGSLVVAEHSRHVILEDRYGTLERTRLLRHGDAELSFYRLA